MPTDQADKDRESPANRAETKPVDPTGPKSDGSFDSPQQRAEQAKAKGLRTQHPDVTEPEHIREIRSEPKG